MFLSLGWSVAAHSQNTISIECLYSLRDLYKFYYYEISPNPNNPPCHLSESLDTEATTQLESVLKEVKQQCPASLIAHVNQSLKDQPPSEE